MLQAGLEPENPICAAKLNVSEHHGLKMVHTKSENSVIIYPPSCCSKPVRDNSSVEHKEDILKNAGYFKTVAGSH